ncbi:Heme-binding protein A [subsurface metagenome]
MAYVRNPHYHDKTTINGKEYEVPFVDELIWPIIPDRSTQIAALRTGKLDIWYCTPTEFTDTLKQSTPELIRKKFAHCTYWVISLRCDREPTSNKKVRQALMLAIDQAAIRDILAQGGEIYTWPVSSQIGGVYTPLDELPPETRALYDYNPEKARQMIIDAGYPNGITGLEIAAMAREPEYVDMAIMAAAYWAEIGVEATVNPLETTALTAYTLAAENDCVTSSRTNANQLQTFEASFLPGMSANTAHYDNPYFTEQLLKAKQTVDVTERNAILKELSVIALDDVPWIPIAVPAWNVTWWPWVKNYYGEWEASSYAFGPAMGYVWIDQALKKDMGY